MAQPSSARWRSTLFRARQQSHAPTFQDDREPAQDDAETRRNKGILVDSAIYVQGERVDSPGSLTKTYKALAARPEADDAMAWIGLYRPDQARLKSLAKRFDLHELALEDAIQAHQRPKLERYDDLVFMVLHAARYIDDEERVEFGELHIFLGENFLITLRHAEMPDLSGVRKRMENNPDLLRMGPEAALYAVIDAVVDAYAPVVSGLEKDIDEIEIQVFRSDPGVSRRIYELSQEVVEFRRATRPMIGMIQRLMAGFARDRVDDELQDYLRDVLDHVQSVVEEVDGFHQALADMLTVNATLVAQQQNEEMRRMQETAFQQGEEVKKISAWAAILFVPGMVPAWYGMNFEHMPELRWMHGPLFAFAVMVGLGLMMYWVFKRRDWL